MMRDINDYSMKYAIPGFENYQVKYRRKMIMEQVEHYNPKRILEIGCGCEPLFKYVHDISFTVVEPSNEFYENAVKLAQKEENIVCIKGLFEDVADKLDDCYDMIICSGLLHEVEEPIKLLCSIESVCNDNTVVHINVPNADSMHRLLALESGIITNTHDMSEQNKTFQQNNVFDLESLKQLVEKSQLNVIEQGSYFVKPFTHAQMYEMIKQDIINEDILEGLYNIGRYMPHLGSEIYVNCKKMGKTN